MTKRLLTAVMAFATAWTIGCAAAARSPEAIPIDHVECARCRMLISSDAGGGEILSPAEETRFYDDLGCLAADWRARPRGARVFVRLQGARWMDGEAAAYARPREVNTAMGSGIVAFATTAEAQSADRDGRAYTFDDVVRLSRGLR